MKRRGRMWKVWKNVEGVEECGKCGRMWKVWKNVEGVEECGRCGRVGELGFVYCC